MRQILSPQFPFSTAGIQKFRFIIRKDAERVKQNNATTQKAPQTRMNQLIQRFFFGFPLKRNAHRVTAETKDNFFFVPFICIGSRDQRGAIDVRLPIQKKSFE